MKVTRCVGEGQGECERCKETKGWNRVWMCFLYEIEGYTGCYCADCVKEILKNENTTRQKNGCYLAEEGAT